MEKNKNLDIEIKYDNISTLDEFLSLTQSIGGLDKAIGNNLYGIDHQGVKGIIPDNRDSFGYAFFTRPQLNLSNSNLANERKLYSFYSTNENSITRYIRCMLDPRLHANKITSKFVDPSMAFIPIMTNNIKSMSGWPDVVLPTYTTPEGIRQEQFIMGDGHTDVYSSYDIDVTFRNTKDEPIMGMISLWVKYISYVFEGILSPYTDFIAENEIDYNTRIYRLVMDESKKYVKKIAAVGAAFPVNDPVGKFFDFSDGTKYNDQTKEINVRFKCVGAEYNDSITIKEFNETGAIFNHEIRKLLDGKKHNLEKIPDELLDIFNHRGYPIINTKTLELEWWVNKDSITYKRIMSTLKIRS